MKMPTDAIRAEIRQSGAIPFARFMELALYCPETGYYESQKDTVGRAGDFITSVSTGSLFGELLAFQFSEWLAEMPKPLFAPLKIVEAGAHDGKLAMDILSWLQKHRSKLFDKLEYHILEPSRSRREWQQNTLAGFAGKVCWSDSLNCFKGYTGYSSSDFDPKFEGILFNNELLDAFPVNRFGWDAKAKTWFEWGVALDGEKFTWAKLDLALDWTCRSGIQPGLQKHGLPQLPGQLLAVLPDGYTIETNTRAKDWWWDKARILRRGKLVAIDYGFTADEQISPARVNGTLRAYSKHQVSDDLLAQPGEQDLTAHVNYTSIRETGEQAGLKTELFCTQPQFLTNILSQACTASPALNRILGQPVKETYFAHLDAKQIRQFQTLTHPEHLGRAFRVLVQARA
jgi:SAM-dependent MidA family methyltransferase